MLWICNGCTAGYSVDAPKCPQCGANDHRDEGTESPTPVVDAANEEAEEAPVVEGPPKK